MHWGSFHVVFLFAKSITLTVIRCRKVSKTPQQLAGCSGMHQCQACRVYSKTGTMRRRMEQRQHIFLAFVERTLCCSVNTIMCSRHTSVSGLHPL